MTIMQTKDHILTSLGRERRGSVRLFRVAPGTPNCDPFDSADRLDGVALPLPGDGGLLMCGVPGTVPGSDVTP